MANIYKNLHAIYLGHNGTKAEAIVLSRMEDNQKIEQGGMYKIEDIKIFRNTAFVKLEGINYWINSKCFDIVKYEKKHLGATGTLKSYDIFADEKINPQNSEIEQ